MGRILSLVACCVVLASCANRDGLLMAINMSEGEVPQAPADKARTVTLGKISTILQKQDRPYDQREFEFALKIVLKKSDLASPDTAKARYVLDVDFLEFDDSPGGFGNLHTSATIGYRVTDRTDKKVIYENRIQSTNETENVKKYDEAGKFVAVMALGLLLGNPSAGGNSSKQREYLTLEAVNEVVRRNLIAFVFDFIGNK